MKSKKRIQIGQGGFAYENELEGMKEIRFSPRSYMQGEWSGFMGGIAVGFVAGVMFICLAFGIFPIQ